MPTVLALSRAPPERWALLVNATVVGAASRPSALTYAEAHRPELVLVDADTPGIDCAALLPELRRASPDSELVVTAAEPSLTVVVEAMRSGASDVLRVPGARARAALSLALGAAETRRIVRSLSADPPAQPDLVGTSSSVAEVRATLRRLREAAPSAVLVEGETGTGKEVVAHRLHAGGPRAERPWIHVHCGALSTPTLESGLFGHVRGAFGSVTAETTGLVEAARGGTLFLDEIADVPLEIQAKLLRLIEEGTYRRPGERAERSADVVLVAATSADLAERARAGRFRTDLYDRLALARVQLAPLRERREDIAALTATFLAAFARRFGREVRGASAAALGILQDHDWPGNVRELRNLVERAFVLYPSMEELRPEHLPPLQRLLGAAQTPLAASSVPLAAADRGAIVHAMAESGVDASAAARRQGTSRALLDRLRRALARTFAHARGSRPALDRKS